ncbi:MAG: DUF5916 domain-containing protein [Flavobacteriaceae bacterium]|uniref:DUF5916 domain-containing protein n=1 Tax=Formosa sp. Hel3_A1_48 TaxID=1336795 RepID=UPI0012FA1E58|nr:DUF5916 domain-containing protein [Formosa sp. Hel3_A1_48]MDG2483760.1 DUF5916 domain-containing protein [Flavobacteriaceae bacterium]
MRYLFLSVFLIFHVIIQAQVRKNLEASPIKNPPVIDGILSEEIWNNLNPATDFTLIWPETRHGNKIPVEFNTTAYVGYDHNAIYIGAILNHPNPDKMPKQFSQRDDIWNVNAETFFVTLNTYNDDLNFFGFQITSAGTVGDVYSSGPIGSDDFLYDTVFDAKVHYNSDSWSLEMVIPYSALRFPEKEVQLWGLNFGRKIQSLDETYVWSPVNANELKYHEYNGTLTGIENISPPIRLFFYPYVQSSINLQKGARSASSYTAGMDIKYGLSSSFTLDASLIPDFGQVAFDNVELNLGPFEQQFSENRAFFTEGATLFEIADGGMGGGSFFYSRRIGEKVSVGDDLLDDDEQIYNLDRTPQLLNTVKVTGTTSKNLSIGFLNAITNKVDAEIENLSSYERRRQTIQPLVNYNVLSLSQQLLNDYSSVSLLNTNKTGSDGLYGNNVAFVADLFDDNRDFNIKIKAFGSKTPKNNNDNGFRSGISLSELKGNFRYNISWWGVDKHYKQNELGYFNFIDHQSYAARISYQILNEYGFLRKYSNYLRFNDTRTFHSFDRKFWGLRFGNDFSTQNLMVFEADFAYKSITKNFDEPRVYNRFVLEPENFQVKLGVQSNKNKDFSYKIQWNNFAYFNEDYDENWSRNRINVSTLYRFSEQFSLSLKSNHLQVTDDVGFLQSINDDIYFGRRDIRTVENNIDFNYFFDSKKWINLKLRNYWSRAKYDHILFSLNENGERTPSDFSLLDFDPDTNFNIWNLDINFEWWFAPGSNLVLLYRNQLFSRDNTTELDYFGSLDNLFDQTTQHQFSLRINYLIDFNRLRKKKT